MGCLLLVIGCLINDFIGLCLLWLMFRLTTLTSIRGDREEVFMLATLNEQYTSGIPSTCVHPAPPSFVASDQLLKECESKFRIPPKIPTHFPFTQKNLLATAAMAKQQGVKQLECCDSKCRGLRAVIYESGKISYHSRYSFHGKTFRKKLGESEYMTIEMAREAHLEIRLLVARGGNPKAVTKHDLSLTAFFEEHVVPNGEGRKKSLHTDQSRFNTWIKPELGSLSLADIGSTMISCPVPDDC